MKRNRLCSSWAKVLGCVLLVVALAACRSTVRVPDAAQPTAQQASVFPDYRDVVIPPNIAPLNFQVNNPADEVVVQIKGQRGEPLVAEAETAGKLRFDSTEWRRLLTDNRGGQLSVEVFTQHEGQWLQHPAWKWTVAAEPIDSFLTYRLIEPSYELYRQLGLYERNLTNFDEHPIYENNDTFEEENNHCVNCHTPQAHGTTGRMLFHVRSKHGGTVFIEGKNIRRVDMKCDSVLGGSVYPAWHPRQPWVVFSSNKTGQAFRLNNAQKVEVVDYDSDLLFYDVQRNKLSNVFRTPAVMETFPAWAPTAAAYIMCGALPEFRHHERFGTPQRRRAPRCGARCLSRGALQCDVGAFRCPHAYLRRAAPRSGLPHHGQEWNAPAHQSRRSLSAHHARRFRPISYLAQEQ